MYGSSEEQLSDEVFGTAGDEVNLKSQFAACSYDQLTIEPTLDRELMNDPNDQTTGIVDGVMSVEVDVEVSRDGWFGVMENSVTAKINEVFDVGSPNDLADHVMYCLPDYGSNWIAAKAYNNHWSSVFNDKYCNYPSVQLHEVGFHYDY